MLGFIWMHGMRVPHIKEVVSNCKRWWRILKIDLWSSTLAEIMATSRNAQNYSNMIRANIDFLYHCVIHPDYWETAID